MDNDNEPHARRKVIAWAALHSRSYGEREPDGVQTKICLIMHRIAGADSKARSRHCLPWGLQLCPDDDQRPAEGTRNSQPGPPPVPETSRPGQARRAGRQRLTMGPKPGAASIASAAGGEDAACIRIPRLERPERALRAPVPRHDGTAMSHVADSPKHQSYNVTQQRPERIPGKSLPSREGTAHGSATRPPGGVAACSRFQLNEEDRTWGAQSVAV